jgi:hypothetical protein
MLEGKGFDFGIVTKEAVESFPSTLSDLRRYKEAGKDPNALLFFLVNTHCSNDKGREALRRFAAGSSAWLQAAWLLSCASE